MEPIKVAVIGVEYLSPCRTVMLAMANNNAVRHARNWGDMCLSSRDADSLPYNRLHGTERGGFVRAASTYRLLNLSHS